MFNDMIIRGKFYAGSAMDSLRKKWNDFRKEEVGGSEIIATVILVAIVVALGVFFRKQLADLMKSLWATISGKAEVFNSDIT